jgi:site-specific DNA-methyltransferase (adenine-specific)
MVRGRSLGFDVLTPIYWFKVGNIRMEASRSSRFLGKPYLPNGIIKNDRETIVMLRKPGYRRPTPEMEELSRIPKDDYFRWFSQLWTDVPGASTRDHPAPFPLEIPRRLVLMFSFVGDTVLDPFAGSGTTLEAAVLSGRHAIGMDIEGAYVAMTAKRLRRTYRVTKFY